MSEELIENIEHRANKLKEEGNHFLTHHLYSSAAEKYTQAIELFPSAVFYSNRAQAYIKMEQYGAAITDANEAIKLDPNYIKAYYRRGSADYALGKLKDALKDFKSVVKIVPKDLDAQKKVKACEKAIREDAFNRAIEVDDVPPPVIDFDAILVESSYSGPRLPDTVADDGKLVDIDFVKSAIEHMKEQKKIHRKYVLQALNKAKEMFQATPTLLRINISQKSNTENKNDQKGHITVCGDTHGQYYDLLHIFTLTGFPSETNPIIFNGDYVDRGSFSFETVFTLLLIKLSCPTAVYMLRGNHETKNMNKMYGFEGEVLHKYDAVVMRLFTEVSRR